MKISVEVVAYSIESAMHAQQGGADRVELCDNPAEGGTTPSLGVMEIVRQALSIDVFAMIRPRGGDFVYSAYEYHAMKRDIEMAKRASLDGVVLGILKPDGRIDTERCRKLIEAARPLQVTCHRAFDFTRDAFEALDDCIAAGFNRILTSGRQPTALEGADVIRRLVQRSHGRISIMAGAGIRAAHVAEVIRATGVTEVHSSARSLQPGVHASFNHLISLTDTLPPGFNRWTADTEQVKALRSVVDGLKLDG
jgi:copper homeostasis protein